MIDLSAFAGKTVAVMGLGRSGLVAAQALAAGGARVRAWDDDPGRRAAAEAAGLPLADLTGDAWGGVGTLVLSPGIPHTHPQPHPAAARARAAKAEIVGDIELLARAQPQAHSIGITGTNGKSTTTALIGHLLARAGWRVAVGGNLGRPALDLDPLDADGWYVIEMSSYQLELTASVAFDVAVLLNISADHLDRHGGMAGYVAAKTRIFDLQKPGGTMPPAAVVGIDDAYCAGIFDRLARSGGRRVVPISAGKRTHGGVYVIDGVLYDDMAEDGAGRNRPVVSLLDIATLPGSHNWQNAAAAYAAAKAAGLDVPAIVDGLRSYPGLAHRQQLAAVIDGVRYVNDSKATNADAAARALACYDAIYWIAGGRGKEGGLAALEPWLGRIRHAYLIGEAAEAMAAALNGKVETTIGGDLETALRAAHAAARREKRPDPVVLLSPACASFDQFTDFEARGRAFCRLAATLPGTARRILCDGREG